jgi:hypothetical protein
VIVKSSPGSPWLPCSEPRIPTVAPCVVPHAIVIRVLPSTILAPITRDDSSVLSTLRGMLVGLITTYRWFFS